LSGREDFVEGLERRKEVAMDIVVESLKRRYVNGDDAVGQHPLRGEGGEARENGEESGERFAAASGREDQAVTAVERVGQGLLLDVTERRVMALEPGGEMGVELSENSAIT
jgi:hypothetical protein